MPKVERERTKFHDKAPPLQPEPFKPDDEAETDEEAANSSTLSRGQRKRMKRREDYMRKFEFVQYVHKEEEKKKSGGLDLSGLAGGLDDALREKSGTASTRTPSARRMGRKAQAIADAREMAQYQGVVGLDVFQRDPLGALEQHLRNGLKQQQHQPQKK